MIPKKAIKLTKAQFAKLAKQTYERDGYRCQIPGCNRCHHWESRLHPHHLILTARIRLDVLENLLTMCFSCHRLLHDGNLDVSIDDLILKYRERLDPWLEWNHIESKA